MRFVEFLRVAVLLVAGAATALAVASIAGAQADDDITALAVGVGWWTVAASVGLWLGRRPEPSAGIGRLLAAARATNTLPEVEPGSIVLARLWPLVVFTLACGAIAFLVPQIPAIAAGYAIGVALTWRRQSAAVQAIEDRDGVRFFLERGAALGAPKLLRTPWARKIDPALAEEAEVRGAAS